MANNKQFVVDITKFTIKSEKTIDDTRKFVAYAMFSRVIDKTPLHLEYLPTTGNTKYNWQCTINAPSTRVLKGVDKKGDVTKARMLKVLERVSGDQTIFFANSVPWIHHLEEGLYPRNPVKGTWNSQTKSYEIRSQGGYSKQSPSGMVKTTVMSFSEISKNALRRAQRENP